MLSCPINGWTMFSLEGTESQLLSYLDDIAPDYVVIGEMEVGGRFACESYGVKVAEQGGDIAVIPNITVSISRIDALVDRMLRNTVSPASARDVVDDWL